MFQIRCTEILLLGACDKQPLYTVTNRIPHGRVVTKIASQCQRLGK